MAKLMPDQLHARHGHDIRAVDEHGREVENVTWIDPEAGTFGQLVLDEDGLPQLDPDDRQLWEITRFGQLRLEQIDRAESPDRDVALTHVARRVWLVDGPWLEDGSIKSDERPPKMTTR